MNYDDIMNHVQMQKARENNKEAIRLMKTDGLTADELKALYTGFVSVNQKHIALLPLLHLWIEEVYAENEE